MFTNILARHGRWGNAKPLSRTATDFLWRVLVHPSIFTRFFAQFSDPLANNYDYALVTEEKVIVGAVTATIKLQKNTGAPFRQPTTRSTKTERDQGITHPPTMRLNIDTLISHFDRLIYIRNEDAQTLRDAATAIDNEMSDDDEEQPDEKQATSPPKFVSPNRHRPS